MTPPLPTILSWVIAVLFWLGLGTAIIIRARDRYRTRRRWHQLKRAYLSKKGPQS